jgi:peptidoglycan/LPS O-acetylase OafA/YrhL
LDAVRALAAQLIVLHHLAFYGPMAERVALVAPGLIDWFAEYARIAVQVFLVMGGFLAASHLEWNSRLDARAVLRSIGRRYLRLFVPFAVAVALALAAGALARPWAGDADWVPDPLSLSALIAHIVLLFAYFDIEALTAGAWYVAIDLELHIVLTLLIWAAQRLGVDPLRARQWFKFSVVVLAGLSALVINRNPELDDMSLYFFGAFSAGIAAFWLGTPGNSRSARLAGVIVLGLIVLALWVDFRLRLAVALTSALAIMALVRLMGAAQTPIRSNGRALFERAVGWLGRSAYSLFLVHFPLSVVINALYLRFFSSDLTAAIVGMLVAWLGSLPLAWLMWRMIESRVLRH